MSNRKKHEANPMEILEAFTRMMAVPGFETLFGGMPGTEKYPYERLNNGFELRPIEILAEGGQFVLENREDYSHLYHNGLKVSDQVFRKGGMSNGFKEGYCALIHYVQKEPHSKKKHGFDFGTHVIINSVGDIVLRGGSFSSDHPYHQGGNVGKVKDTYYNLTTGEPIVTASSTGSINGQQYIIFEHRYDWYNKNLPLGVYQLHKTTCEFIKIDDIKK